MRDIPKTRWYQFSLRTLLVLLTVIAVAAGWYGYRVRLLEQERIRLSGKWYHVGDYPKTVDAPHIDVSNERIVLHVPQGEVGCIDFHMVDGSGISRGIYHCEGDIIMVAQGETGFPRPTGFDERPGVSVWTAKRPPQSIR